MSTIEPAAGIKAACCAFFAGSDAVVKQASPLPGAKPALICGRLRHASRCFAAGKTDRSTHEQGFGSISTRQQGIKPAAGITRSTPADADHV